MELLIEKTNAFLWDMKYQAEKLWAKTGPSSVNCLEKNVLKMLMDSKELASGGKETQEHQVERRGSKYL